MYGRTLNTENELWNLLDVIHKKSNMICNSLALIDESKKNQYIGNNSSSIECDYSKSETEELCKSSANVKPPNSLRSIQQSINSKHEEELDKLKQERDSLYKKLAELEIEVLTHHMRGTENVDENATNQIGVFDNPDCMLGWSQDQKGKPSNFASRRLEFLK